jgi:hypothetical protein
VCHLSIVFVKSIWQSIVTLLTISIPDKKTVRDVLFLPYLLTGYLRRFGPRNDVEKEYCKCEMAPEIISGNGAIQSSGTDCRVAKPVLGEVKGLLFKRLRNGGLG